MFKCVVTFIHCSYIHVMPCLSDTVFSVSLHPTVHTSYCFLMFTVSHKFGYGLMDAGAMVTLAEQWTSVPPQHICKSQEISEER